MSYFENWNEEKRSSYLYKLLSEHEKAPAIRALFARLSQEASKQAQLWQDKALAEGSGFFPEFTPDTRTRIVAALIKRIPPRRLRSVLTAMKIRGMSAYSAHPPSGHAMPSDIADVGRGHRGVGSSGNLRAAVFGVSDGLVSNASLLLGVAAAAQDSHFILLSGIAGLLAGASSMAAGEYISVRSQREMFEYQIGLERDELHTYPNEEAAELSLIYQAKGMPEDEAERLAKRLISDPEKALDTLAREELGLNPEDLGSPIGAAIFSFLAFSAGALIPLGPYLFLPRESGFSGSIGITAISLFTVGATLSLFTGRSALLGGLRMMMMGGLAGGITYLIGHFVGVAV